MTKKILGSLLIVSAVGCAGDSLPEAPEVTERNPLDSSLSTRVIYGEDDRLDVFQVEDNRLKEFARSTAVLMFKSQLTPANGVYAITADTFKNEFKLCDSEPFANQLSAGYCSSFLISSTMAVTAGHCIRTQANCEKTALVFDYAVHKEGSPGPTSISKKSVYNCKKVIRSGVDGNGADYAVIELDRPAMDREPLDFRKSGEVSVGEPLVVIGNPSGIPTKVAGGAEVRSQASGFFVANLDTYGGNSGSAVFNANTGLVEGILVRGENDFVWKSSCRVSNVCSDEGCRGEDVTHITAAFKSLARADQSRILGDQTSRKLVRKGVRRVEESVRQRVQ